MPQIGKKSLSQYIRTGCLRQLALDLFPDNQTYRPERQARAMPHPQSPRPGLRQVQAAGDEWAEEKLHDLTQTFGQPAVLGDRRITPTNHIRYEPVPLGQYIGIAVPIQFIVEADFPMGASFQTALGLAGYATRFSLHYSELRPDIIAVLAPGTFAAIHHAGWYGSPASSRGHPPPAPSDRHKAYCTGLPRLLCRDRALQHGSRGVA